MQNVDDDFIVGYMCKIDYDYELGNNSDGTLVYPSIEALKECHTCWEGCGIVEVRVSYIKTIVEATDEGIEE